MFRILTLALVLSFASNAAACDDHAESELSLRSIAAGTQVADRRLIGAGDTFEVGAPVWVHIAVNNPGPADQVTMVWHLEGEFVWEMELDVGTSGAWRTWTRMRMPTARTGQWTVEVLDPNGDPMGDVSFDVVGRSKAPAVKPAPVKPTPVKPATVNAAPVLPRQPAVPAQPVTAPNEDAPAETAALFDDEPGC